MLKIQEYFKGIGGIHESKTSSMITYQVPNIKSLLLIIDHFIKYPLLLHKTANFNVLKEGYHLFIEKAYLTHEGCMKILCLKALLNKGISNELSERFSEIKLVEPNFTSNTLKLINPQ